MTITGTTASSSPIATVATAAAKVATVQPSTSTTARWASLLVKFDSPFVIGGAAAAGSVAEAAALVAAGAIEHVAVAKVTVKLRLLPGISVVAAVTAGRQPKTGAVAAVNRITNCEVVAVTTAAAAGNGGWIVNASAATAALGTVRLRLRPYANCTALRLISLRSRLLGASRQRLPAADVRVSAAVRAEQRRATPSLPQQS